MDILQSKIETGMAGSTNLRTSYSIIVHRQLHLSDNSTLLFVKERMISFSC